MLPLDLFRSTPPCRREMKSVISFYKECKDGTEERKWNKRVCAQRSTVLSDIPYL